MPLHFRQGDVMVTQVEQTPKEELLKEVPREDNKVVLAHGEVTGHAHTISHQGAKLFEGFGKRFLTLSKECVLEHQEHAPITMPAGTYEVVIQREYHPQEVRRVVD